MSKIISAILCVLITSCGGSSLARGENLGRLPVEFANVASIKKSLSGDLLVVDSDSGRIFKIKESGQIIWSTGSDLQSLGVVVSLATLPGHKLLVLDNTKPAVNIIENSGVINRIAGNGILKWADIEIEAKKRAFGIQVLLQ